MKAILKKHKEILIATFISGYFSMATLFVMVLAAG